MADRVLCESVQETVRGTGYTELEALGEVTAFLTLMVWL